MRDRSEDRNVIDKALRISCGLLSEALGLSQMYTESQRYSREMELAVKYVPSGGKILDVGCKLGIKLIALQLLGRQSFGVDNKYVFGMRKIDSLKDVWKKAGVEIEECDVCITPLPHSDESFDGVMCCAVLEHLHSSPRFPLNEMKRVLKSEGIMIITVPNLGSVGKRINFLLGRGHYLSLRNYFFGSGPIYGHIREFYPHEVMRMLDWVGGLKIIHLSLFNHDPTIPSNPIKLMYSKFLGFLSFIYPNFRSAIIVVAQKTG